MNWFTAPEWRPGRDRAVIGFAVLYFLAVTVWLGVAPDTAWRQPVDDLSSLILPLLATWSAATAARLPRLDSQARRAWRYSAWAFLLFGTGNLVWAVYNNLLQENPATTWADAIYLFYYPLLLSAFLTFYQKPKGRPELRRLLLDVGTVVLAGGAVIWYLVLEPRLRLEHASAFDAFIALGYPVGDLILLFGCALALLYQPSPVNRDAIRIMGLAGLVVLITNVVYGNILVQTGTYPSGIWLDAGWELAALLWVIAPQYHRWRASAAVLPEAASVESSRPLSPLPYVAMAAGYGLLVIVAQPYWNTALGGVLLAIVLLTTIVVIRQIGAVKDNLRLHAERAAQEARFRSLVQHSSDMIMVVDQVGAVQFASPSALTVLGWHPERMLDRPFTEWVHPDDSALARTLFARALSGSGAPVSSVWRQLHGAGGFRHVEIVATNLLTDPAVGGIVFNTRDVSERAALEAELHHRAHHDPLTGLANRAWFLAHAEQALAHPRQTPSQVAVLFFDLDNFKTVNDSFGHATGDRLLVEVAQRLLSATRGNDTVARLGGDEFAILVNRVGSDGDLAIIADRVAHVMRQPFGLGEGEVFTSVSVGIARGSAGIGVDELLRNADVAMYVAKRRGKERHVFFEPGMQAAVRERLELEIDLRQALERGQLELAYQPIVSLKDGRAIGAESLIRWHHPVRGNIPPAHFLPMAEETGLMLPLGRFVLTEACRQAARWQSGAGKVPFRIGINLSGRQLQNPGIVQDVKQALSLSGLPPEALVLEITEQAVIGGDRNSADRLRELKALGVLLAMDDFGTGYSSLAVLQKLPIDIIKLDKSFLADLTPDSGGVPLVQSILGLGEALGLVTILEGVEEVHQVELLNGLGARYGQGYHFARPMSALQFSEGLAAGGVFLPGPRLVTGEWGAPAEASAA